MARKLPNNPNGRILTNQLSVLIGLPLSFLLLKGKQAGTVLFSSRPPAVLALLLQSPALTSGCHFLHPAGLPAVAADHHISVYGIVLFTFGLSIRRGWFAARMQLCVCVPHMAGRM